VVAEGIETQEQLNFLRDCRCDYGQGYLFSKPLPLDDLKHFCTKHHAPTTTRQHA
jgi:EAL domain-containing protein (putative c-di-GMP-specific phosphodiesterase class I)